MVNCTLVGFSFVALPAKIGAIGFEKTEAVGDDGVFRTDDRHSRDGNFRRVADGEGCEGSCRKDSCHGDVLGRIERVNEAFSRFN